MKYFYFLLGMLCTGALVAQDCNARFQQKSFSNIGVTTVKYGEAVNRNGQNQELMMDIYQPLDDQSADRPMVIFCFGGAFVAGDRTSDELIFFASELAKRGFVCASIDYRLGEFADLVAPETAVKTVIRAVHDGKAAIRYLRKTVDADGNPYRINPATIFMGGTSAGGILAAHVAYLDDVSKTPTDWQGWIADLGGLEGASGTPDYCSKPNGVFAFSGAIGDTAWIDPDDVPMYNVHSTDDETVPYLAGRPLGGNVPLDLNGGGLIDPHLSDLGTYTLLDTYNDDFHPSFQTDNPDTSTMRAIATDAKLADFLFNILPCNTNNQIKAGQDQCQSFGVGIINNAPLAQANAWPNPVENTLFIETTGATSYFIADMQGRVILDGNISTLLSAVDVSVLKTGTYVLRLANGQQKLIVKK